MNRRSIWQNLRTTASTWSDHEAPRLAAALAFYSILSLAPLVIIAVGIAAIVFGRVSAQTQITGQVEALIGIEGGNAVRGMLEHAGEPASSGIFASVLATLTLLFGAAGVFGELRSALNKIWDLEPEPSTGLWNTVRERLFSVGMVLAVGFLLLVSLLLNAVLAAVGKLCIQVLPLPEIALSALNFLISFIAITILFALIIKYVPKREIDWKDVCVGAAATAFFFTLGKYLIGLYLGKTAVGSAYGAAGSLVVVIVWIYYSSLVFLFGAEFTRVLQDDGLSPAEARENSTLAGDRLSLGAKPRRP